MTTMQSIQPARGLEIALPASAADLSQDAEWCVARVGGEWRRVRLHDYQSIYAVPGLYERVIYDILECQSPQVVCGMLVDAVRRRGESPRALRVLDLGAGNGIVGATLVDQGVEQVIGVDILAVAARAAERDRPGVYDDYHIVDMSSLSPAERHEFVARRLNCLVCVAALGFGDIPIEVFGAAYNLIAPGGWVAFNIKEDFVRADDQTGFATLVRRMQDEGAIAMEARRRYRHRLGIDREPLYYNAFVGRKRRDIRP